MAPVSHGPQDGGNGWPLDEGYVVFSQQGQALDVGALNAHAERFFDTRVGLAEPPMHAESGVTLRLVVTPSDGASGIVSVRGRPRDDGDLARSEAAEARMGGGGLALLARRCVHVWRIERRTVDDALALRLAAILASVVLGPILDPATLEMFGVRTARAKLAATTTG